MPRYTVHLYREMRLTFTDIEADTPQAAAKHASGLPTEYADSIDDCDGEDFGALVDLQGDEEYEHSVMIDFETERLRKAAPDMLNALHDAETEISEILEDLCDEPKDDISAHRTLATIRAAISKATGKE